MEQFLQGFKVRMGLAAPPRGEVHERPIETGLPVFKITTLETGLRFSTCSRTGSSCDYLKGDADKAQGKLTDVLKIMFVPNNLAEFALTVLTWQQREC